MLVLPARRNFLATASPYATNPLRGGASQGFFISFYLNGLRFALLTAPGSFTIGDFFFIRNIKGNCYNHISQRHDFIKIIRSGVGNFKPYDIITRQLHESRCHFYPGIRRGSNDRILMPIRIAFVHFKPNFPNNCSGRVKSSRKPFYFMSPATPKSMTWLKQMLRHRDIPPSPAPSNVSIKQAG